MDPNDYKQLHLVAAVKRHTQVVHLWRALCTCGQYFLAATEDRARAGLDHHITAEEPFPDLGLEPEPGNGASNGKD